MYKEENKDMQKTQGWRPTKEVSIQIFSDEEEVEVEEQKTQVRPSQLPHGWGSERFDTLR